MGFFDRFKKKKPLTPAELRETLAKLRESVAAAALITDTTERDNECKRLLISIDQTLTRVNTTLASVEADLEDLMGRSGWWATQDAVNSDIRGLRRGRETLIAAKEELTNLSNQLISIIKEKVDGEGGLGQNEPAAE